MSDVNGSVERYITLWNETDGKTRANGIAEIFAADATYTDPLAAVSGRDGIDTVIAGAQGQFPGYTFKLLANAESNHNIARFSWELIPDGGGESLVIGSDVAVFGDDGKIRSVYGFLDKVPQA
jgi:SnoaL-like domain